MKELLHRLNFVYKKPKYVPGKLDPAKQVVFVTEYEKILLLLFAESELNRTIMEVFQEEDSLQ